MAAGVCGDFVIDISSFDYCICEAVDKCIYYLQFVVLVFYYVFGVLSRDINYKECHDSGLT